MNIVTRGLRALDAVKHCQELMTAEELSNDQHMRGSPPDSWTEAQVTQAEATYNRISEANAAPKVRGYDQLIAELHQELVAKEEQATALLGEPHAKFPYDESRETFLWNTPVGIVTYLFNTRTKRIDPHSKTLLSREWLLCLNGVRLYPEDTRFV